MQRRRRVLCAAALAMLAWFAGLGTACHKRAASGPGAAELPSGAAREDLACIRRLEDGCVLCAAKRVLIDGEEHRQRLCNPRQPGDCVEFCTALAGECATAWHAGPSCLAVSEDDFRRRLFWLDAADRPEADLVGRVVDDESHKIDGARIELADGPTVVAEATTGKDGGFRIPLRAGGYTVRVSKLGRATLIEGVRLAPERAAPVHVFRLGPEERIGGRIVDETGGPVPGATVVALRTLGDPLAASEARSGLDGGFALRGLDDRRYMLRISAFGFRAPEIPRVQAPASHVTVKAAQTHVVRGLVTGSDGTPQPEASILVVAIGTAADNAVRVWTSGPDGRYAFDGFAPGTYLVWAHRGDRTTYPPMRVSLESEDLEPFDLDLKLDHEGALVRGFVIDADGHPAAGIRIELQPRWPLALPVPLSGETGRDGKFEVDGLTPGRYEIAVRQGARPLAVLAGPREVQVPIEEGERVDLEGKIQVRRNVD